MNIKTNSESKQTASRSVGGNATFRRFVLCAVALTLLLAALLMTLLLSNGAPKVAEAVQNFPWANDLSGLEYSYAHEYWETGKTVTLIPVDDSGVEITGKCPIYDTTWDQNKKNNEQEKRQLSESGRLTYEHAYYNKITHRYYVPYCTGRYEYKGNPLWWLEHWEFDKWAQRLYPALAISEPDSTEVKLVSGFSRNQPSYVYLYFDVSCYDFLKQDERGRLRLINFGAINREDDIWMWVNEWENQDKPHPMDYYIMTKDGMISQYGEPEKAASEGVFTAASSGQRTDEGDRKISANAVGRAFHKRLHRASAQNVDRHKV